MATIRLSGARSLSLEEARQIAREDPSLLWLDAVSTWAVGDRVRGDGAAVADEDVEDVEDGTVVAVVSATEVRVAWDSGVTPCDADQLSRVAS